jgi:hypothetical protein
MSDFTKAQKVFLIGLFLGAAIGAVLSGLEKVNFDG